LSYYVQIVMYLDSFCSECDTHPCLYLSIEFIVCTMYLVWGFIVCTMYLVWGLMSVLCIFLGVYCLYYVSCLGFIVCTMYLVFVLFRCWCCIVFVLF
jgi:hypothetical protein